jgi:predicted DNA-binding transcriptional regulator YafY
MAITKNPLERYRILDNLLSNVHKRYTLDDLLEKVNEVLEERHGASYAIERRQLFKDIAFIESESGYAATIVRDYSAGKKPFYYYEDPAFTINDKPLSDKDLKDLRSAMEIIGSVEGIAQFEWMQDFVAKFKSSEIENTEGKKYILYDDNLDLKGREYIKVLFQLIYNKRVLSVSYKSFVSDKKETIIFHPHFLKEYNNRWYVFGWHEKVNNFTNLALDRIEGIKELKKKFNDCNINAIEYFDDFYGVTRLIKSIENVILKIDKNLVPYIVTKPIHQTQKGPELLPDGNSVIRLNLIPNYELETLILSHGEKIEVIEPKSLREAIAQRIKSAYTKYQKRKKSN